MCAKLRDTLSGVADAPCGLFLSLLYPCGCYWAKWVHELNCILLSRAGQKGAVTDIHWQWVLAAELQLQRCSCSWIVAAGCPRPQIMLLSHYLSLSLSQRMQLDKCTAAQEPTWQQPLVVAAPSTHRPNVMNCSCFQTGYRWACHKKWLCYWNMCCYGWIHVRTGWDVQL